MNKKLLIFLDTLLLSSFIYYINNTDINNFFDNQYLVNTNDNKDLNTSSQRSSIIKVIIIIICILLIFFFLIKLVILFINKKNKEIQKKREIPEKELKKELAREIRKILSRENIKYQCLSYSNQQDGEHTIDLQIHYIDSQKKEDVFKKLFDEPKKQYYFVPYPPQAGKKEYTILDKLYKILFTNHFTEDEITIIKAIRLSLIDIDGSRDPNYLPFFKIESNEIKNFEYLNKLINKNYINNLTSYYYKNLQKFRDVINYYLQLDFSSDKNNLITIKNNNGIYMTVKGTGNMYHYTPLFLTFYLVCDKLLEIYIKYNKYEKMPKKVLPVYSVIKKFLKFYRDQL